MIKNSLTAYTQSLVVYQGDFILLAELNDRKVFPARCRYHQAR